MISAFKLNRSVQRPRTELLAGGNGMSGQVVFEPTGMGWRMMIEIRHG
jgi:hypothetical protein